MADNRAIAGWAVEHRAIARGRLLTLGRELSTALHEADRLVGYLDGDRPDPHYLELGMEAIQSHLLRAVRALDMGDMAKPLEPDK